MNFSPTNMLAKNSFLLSVLLHITFIFLISIVITYQPEKQKIPPDVYTHAYVYNNATTTPSASQPAKNTSTQNNTQQNQKSKAVQQFKDSTFSNLHTDNNIKPLKQKSFMQMSRDIIRNDQMQTTMNSFKNAEPILLIGDKSQSPDPFVKELGRCLSANLHYPKMEGELGTRGRVIVSMMIHPNGEITDVQVIKSSETRAFDNAALYASNQAPNLRGADRYLDKPKYFVVGFIFE